MDMVREMPEERAPPVTDGSYAIVVTALAGALVLGHLGLIYILGKILLQALAFAMETIKHHMVREQRRAERKSTNLNVPPMSTPAGHPGNTASEGFRAWQTGRVMLHSSGLNALTAIVWAHAAAQSECLTLVASAMALTEIMAAASLLLRNGTPLTWRQVRTAVLGLTCVVDLVILLFVVPAAVSPQLHEDSSTCSLPQSTWLNELMHGSGFSAALPTSSVGSWDDGNAGLRHVITHLIPINFLVGLSYAITAVDIAGWDPAIVVASVSLQVVESVVILIHPRLQGDADGQLQAFTLVCQWLSFGAALIATATLYAPLTRECYYAQMRRTSEGLGEGQCAVCMEGAAMQAFVPCGHRCCKGCSDRIMSTNSICPHCRSTATEAIRIF